MFKTLIKGTLILTITGLITRIIGFIYKIYLSNILGANMLGIYQLIFPIFSICFTIFGAGIQTAISQITATDSENKQYIKNVLAKSLILSVTASVLLSLSVFFAADFIAIRILGEIQCADPIRILTFAFPVCAVAACINGCYYGMKKAGVPAISQLIEQIARVTFVYITAMLIAGDNVVKMCMIAVAGIAIGEGISMLYSTIRIIMYLKKQSEDMGDNCKQNEVKPRNNNNQNVTSVLLRLSAPLTGNRLVIALLHSIETILIPVMLRKHGMDPDKALSVYGVLTGMAMPLIMFPSTITNSLSVLLLPAISEVSNDSARVKRISKMCIICSLILGIFSTILFIMFGADLGSKVFHDESVGLFVEILAFLCPFLFTATTLASVINGLGYTHYTFIITIIGLSIRILMTIRLVPATGISGYLISLLVSQLAITSMSYVVYKKTLRKFN